MTLRPLDLLLYRFLQETHDLRELIKKFAENGYERTAESIKAQAVKVFQGLHPDKERMIVPTTPDGEWIYKRPTGKTSMRRRRR